MKTDAYVRYMKRVAAALGAGYSKESIVEELKRERATIYPRCVMKQATLAMDKNIYKKREAARAASECISAIDQIVEELTPKEITA